MHFSCRRAPEIIADIEIVFRDQELEIIHDIVVLSSLIQAKLPF